MKFLAILIPLALCGPAFAWPEGVHKFIERKAHNNADNSTSAKNATHNGNSVKAQCNKMQKLTSLMDLVNNATKLQTLETKGKLNATQVDRLKAKASNATAELKTLQANSTLMTSCAVVFAHEELQSTCKAMNKLQKLVDLSKNTTAMQELETKKKLNATEVTKFQEKIGNATTKLTKLMSNTTLATSCAELKKSSSNSSSSASSTSSSTSAQSTSNAASGLQVSSGVSMGLSTLLVGFIAALL